MSTSDSSPAGHRGPDVVPSGLWPGSSPALIAAHERTLALVDTEPRHGGRFGQLGPLLVVFVAVLGATCLALSSVFERFPGIDLDELSLERRKYEHYASQHESFDVVFVGSSQVYRHIDARLFDARLEAAGHPVESFNFGLPGMFFPEVLTTVDWILAQDSDRLKWLFVELRELEPEPVAENELSRREIHVHGPRATALELGLAFQADLTPGERYERARWALRHFLYRTGNVSLAYPLVRSLLGIARPAPARWASRGFYAIDTELAQNPEDRLLRKRRELFRASRDEYDQKMADYRAEPDRREPSELHVDVYRDLVERIRGAGVEPVFFIGSPGWSKYGEIRRAHELGLLPVLFEYHDVDEHPELHEREALFDVRHLRTPGARRFTRLLSDDFAQWLQTR